MIRTSILFFLLFFSLNAFTQKDKSIKVEIAGFEQHLFSLPIDSTLDSTATYHAVFEWTRSSKIKANGSQKKGGEYSYRKPEQDSILCKDLIARNRSKLIKDQFIVSKENVYERLKKHSLRFEIAQYIIGFDQQYLLIRSSSLYSTTNSRQTGPSFFVEKYVYYTRKS